jgi:hypothetical protein
LAFLDFWHIVLKSNEKRKKKLLALKELPFPVQLIKSRLLKFTDGGDTIQRIDFLLLYTSKNGDEKKSFLNIRGHFGWVI